VTTSEIDGAIEPVAIRLPRSYDVDLLIRDLGALRDYAQSAQPGPYHDGEWTGLSLHSMGGKQSADPSAAGLGTYQPTEALAATPYFAQILDELECPKEVVRILTLPPGGHIKEHFDYHTSFQYGMLRLHIAIVTDPAVEFVIGGERVDFRPGELWYGDFSKVHSVENKSSITRVHLVIDVQINDFVLDLFPPDYVARRRVEGIAITRQPLSASEAELRRYTCDVRIPGELMPLFVLGKKLQTLIRGAEASIRVVDGALTVLLDGEPAFVLGQVGEGEFGIAGLPPGITFQFVECDGRVQQIDVHLKGLPKDLYLARLGYYKGPAIPDRTIALAVEPV
jgi:quercetin dioxygenase-like cupin family protein